MIRFAFPLPCAVATPRILLMCALLSGVAGCGDARNPTADPPPKTVVSVATPIERDVTDYEIFTGHTKAVTSVDIRSRVSGYLQEVHFKPGEEVEVGQLLFTIDPRPYQAELDQGLALLEQAEARLKLADLLLDRGKKLRAQPGVMADEDFDKRVGERNAFAAAVSAAKANVERLRLNLDFTSIKAPHAGRVSHNMIDEGNLVMADQTLLTNLSSVDHMHVYFDVDEPTILRIQSLIREGQFSSARRNDVKVFVGLGNSDDFPFQGIIDFVDNHVDRQTASMRVRAKLPNPANAEGDRFLTPGLFARVRLPIGRPHPALLVADRAVGIDQGQKFVLVVNDQGTVEPPVHVKLGDLHDGLREVVAGLTPGQKVIVVGLQRVRPGTAVDPKPMKMPLPVGATMPTISVAAQPKTPATDAEKPASSGAATADK